MRYGSVCSGIEAATVAWHPLGWAPVFYSEIDKFPSAVLAHHYPTVPNLGDMTQFKEWPVAALDLLVGGTPCQSFSVAGLRAGLADPRGNLALTFLAVADKYRPRWVVWENVPGVLSSAGGRDFGAFVGGLAELGYGWAYRILDAQHFGLAQRRRRVFVVGCLGGWQRAAAVLFERASLSGHPAPRREAGEAAPAIPSRSTAGGGLGTDFDCDGGLIQAFGGNNTSGPIDIATACQAHGGPHGRMDFGSETFIAHSLRADGFDDASEDGTGRGTPIVPIQCNGTNVGVELPSLRRGDGGLTSGVPAVAFDWQSGGDSRGLDPKDTAQLQRCQVPALHSGMQVRRLTPRECERLQGFPDDYTLIPYRGKPAADGPRYKALGNSMAVPVMRWIGERIARVSALDGEAQSLRTGTD
jgi:DNA (cytosine-5)-methyltransferase 1